MASMKSKKGSPFERDVAYSLKESGFNVEVLGDNTKGIDIIASDREKTYYIECKFHKGFSWNELMKVYEKTRKTTRLIGMDIVPIVVFKANRQPPLVMVEDHYVITVMEFNSYFKGCYWNKRPKGYKLWK